MSLNHSPKIVTNGLVLCLDASDIKSYPKSGWTWFDRSGSGKNGTLIGGVGYDSGNKGSLTFDGSNDYIDTSLIVPPNSPFTISSWVYLASGHGSYPMIASPKIHAGGGIGSFFGVNIGSNGADGFNLYLGPTIQTNNNNAPLINTWHNAVGVYNSTAKVYVNSVLLSETLSGSSAGFPDGPWIGNGSVLGNSFWKGNISQFSIYNKALSQSEIQQNFNATRGRYNL